MRRLVARLLVAVSVALSWSVVQPGDAQAVSPLTGVSVETRVTRDALSGLFRYEYRVVNPSANDGQIRHLDIELTRTDGDQVLSREGLANGPEYAQHGSEQAFARVLMVPVGIDGPPGWTYGLGFEDTPVRRGLAAWGSTDEPYRVPPGQALGGFFLVSPGLPGIRRVVLEPSVEPPAELHEWPELNAFYESFAFSSKSVGPKALPQTVIALDLLNYLIALLHDSRAQGWVRSDGSHQSLLAKLVAAKRSLEDDQDATAKLEVAAFVSEVQATSCLEFTCAPEIPLTSQAYAVLYFNGQYLVDQLPRPGRHP